MKKFRQVEISHQIQGSGVFNGITMGTVVDTNDPQQMGRVRVVCPALNDSFDADLDTIPWANYSSPFAGFTPYSNMGPDNDQKNEQPIAYGMWMIPKVGAQVLVICVDGNPNYRFYIGSIYTQHTPDSMPHGRYFYQQSDYLAEKGSPSGPFATLETPIQPLFDNFKEAFGLDRDKNFEWRTRGADYSVSALDKEALQHTISRVPDDKNVDVNGFNVTNGYGQSRIRPDKENDLDSQVYSMTTPGMHAVSMDDRVENCRMRFRTSSGHQIILDDTNERIYISTAKGNTWIEMDQSGDVDVFAAKRVSLHGVSDVNIVSNEAIRLSAKSIHMRTTEGVFIEADAGVALQGASIDIKTTGDAKFSAAGNMHLKGGSNTNITAGSLLNLKAGGNINQTASAIYLNGPAATAASDANDAAAYTANKVPQHEPYGRILISKAAAETSPSKISDVLDLINTGNTSSILDVSYSSNNVGKEEYGETITRGKYWRR